MYDLLYVYYSSLDGFIRKFEVQFLAKYKQSIHYLEYSYIGISMGMIKLLKKGQYWH